MDNFPRQKLSEIISQYSCKLIYDPRRLEALLRDHCSAYKREVNVLAAALKERVPFELLKANDSFPQGVILARLVKRLMEDLGLSEDVAIWAVETWALALGVISELILTLGPGVYLELVRIPAGEFLMGSDKSKDKYAWDNETP